MTEPTTDRSDWSDIELLDGYRRALGSGMFRPRSEIERADEIRIELLRRLSATERPDDDGITCSDCRDSGFLPTGDYCDCMFGQTSKARNEQSPIATERPADGVTISKATLQTCMGLIEAQRMILGNRRMIPAIEAASIELDAALSAAGDGEPTE